MFNFNFNFHFFLKFNFKFNFYFARDFNFVLNFNLHFGRNFEWPARITFFFCIIINYSLNLSAGFKKKGFLFPTNKFHLR